MIIPHLGLKLMEGLPAVKTAVWPSTEPVPVIASPDIGEKWKAVAEIVIDLAGDGGLKIIPSEKPIALRRNPVRKISDSKKDVLLGLAITELASISYSEKSRKKIE